MTTTTTPPSSTPPPTPSTQPNSTTPTVSAARMRWARRARALAELWRRYRRDRAGLLGLALMILVVLAAVLAPWVTDAGGLSVINAPGPANHPPMSGFPFGTDENGRSILLLTWWGSRVSLLVGISAAALTVVLGTLVGMFAAHFRGVVSAVLLRITDFFLVLPSLVLAIVLSTVLARGLGTIILAIAVTAWPTTARLVRAQTLTIQERPYIERATALGAGHLHIIAKHVLPGVLPLVFANATLNVAYAIVTESTLSFLGLGDPSKISWGTMLEDAHMNATLDEWWYLIPPGVAIVIVVLAFTLCGRALESALNPKSSDSRRGG